MTPKVLKANGKAQKINVKVTKGKKPVAGATVKITGPGINKTVKTGKNGKVTVDREAGQAGDHPRRDPGREDMQHPADRRRRRLRAGGHRVAPRASSAAERGGGSRPSRRSRISPAQGDIVPRTRGCE